MIIVGAPRVVALRAQRNRRLDPKLSVLDSTTDYSVANAMKPKEFIFV